MLIESFTPVLFRSDGPKTEADIQAIAAKGIRLVIDLENEEGEGPWEKSLASKYGITVIWISLSGFFSPSKADVQKILNYLVQAFSTGQKLLLHCLHGQDRTGLIVGLFRIRYQGWPKLQAWNEMVEHGFHFFLLGLTFFFWCEG